MAQQLAVVEAYAHQQEQELAKCRVSHSAGGPVTGICGDTSSGSNACLHGSTVAIMHKCLLGMCVAGEPSCCKCGISSAADSWEASS